MINMTSQKDNIVEGVILKADFGFGMKYRDEENLYLKLEIQDFEGYECVQLFSMDKVGKLLLQFKGDYRSESALSNLVHQRLYMLNDDDVHSMPSAIAKLPPSQYPQYDWISNDNWS